MNMRVGGGGGGGMSLGQIGQLLKGPMQGAKQGVREGKDMATGQAQHMASRSQLGQDKGEIRDKHGVDMAQTGQTEAGRNNKSIMDSTKEASSMKMKNELQMGQMAMEEGMIGAIAKKHKATGEAVKELA